MSEEKISDKFDFTQIKIKKEKFDEEIEKKLNPNDYPVQNTDCIKTENSIDDKTIIEPVKSSNEILAELFKVFNAEPPLELLSDKNLLKKYKRKEKKRKKRKKSKNNETNDGEINSDSSLKSANSKHKKKKHKKRKTESNNNEKRSEEKKSHKRKASKTSDFEISDLEPDDSLHLAAQSSNSNSTNDEHNFDLSKVKIEKVIKEEKVEKKPLEIKEKLIGKVKTEPADSDISLSDEETFLEQKKRETTSRSAFYRSSASERKYYDRDRYENNRSYYKHSSDHRYNDRSRYRRRSNDRVRYRSRSRSPRSDLGIDKKRLLEIARKNAINMFKNGSLPGCAEMTEEIKDKVLLKMRYGGKTVQDLTDFCRKLSNGENLNELSELSSDEDSEHDKDGNKKVFHHPFVIKEREPIVLHIRNSIPIAPKSADQAKAILMQFPVSSGQEHRNTEEWVPVSAKPETKTQSIGPVLPKPAVTKNVFHKPLPAEEQQPAFRPLNLSPKEVEPALVTTATKITCTTTTNNNETVVNCPNSSAAEKTNTYVPTVTEFSVPPPPMLPLLPSVNNNPMPIVSIQIPTVLPSVSLPPLAIDPVASVPVASVFPTRHQPVVDVSAIISKRLNAMRRLQDNPGDTEAISMMYNSQEEMSTWASSKFTPGQFTGSTGANVLSAKELTSGFQAWVRKDQLTSTVPVTGGMGMHLLKKMGWKPGEGLGREKNGALQPLLLDVKLDKRGLEANDENNESYLRQNSGKRKRGNLAQSQVNLESKHPVCLLNELAAKRKWIPPLYELAHDEGPAHNKTFLFRIILNGNTYKPQIVSNTKKDAKFEAAKFCLQQIGVLPTV